MRNSQSILSWDRLAVAGPVSTMSLQTPGPTFFLLSHVREGTWRDTLWITIQHHLHPLSKNHSSSSGIRLEVFWALNFSPLCAASMMAASLCSPLLHRLKWRRRCYTTTSIWPTSLSLSQLNFTLLLTWNSEISHEAGSLQAGKGSWTEGNWFDLV